MNDSSAYREASRAPGPWTLSGAAAPRRFKWLQAEQWILLVITVLPAARPLFVEAGTIPLGTRMLAAVLWILALLPAWQYLSTPAEQRRPIPFLPVLGVLYGLYYALPVALDAFSLNYAVWLNPEKDYGQAVLAELLCWSALLTTYGAINKWKFRPVFERLVTLNPPEDVWALRLFFVGLLGRLFLAFGPAAQLNSIVGFVSSLSTYGLVVLVVRWRQGRLRGLHRFIVAVGVFVLAVVEIGTGSVATLAFLFTTTGLAYWAASTTRLRPTALAALVFGIVFVIVLKGVTAEFRQTAWYGGTDVTIAERAELAAGLVVGTLQSDGLGGSLSVGRDATAKRSSNSDTMAEVMRRTPSEVPFWNGETYATLVTSLIPRILWPDKPIKNLGHDFGDRYGFIGAKDFQTSFNFPWLVEGYANFGWTGVLAVGLVVGFLTGAMDQHLNVPGQSAWTTAVGIAVLTPLFNIESDFSLKYGGLPLTLLTFLAVTWFIASARKRPRLYTAPQ
jgi:hypothetical protein